MQLLTVAEVAERVGLSEWAVRRAIHDGELVACKLRGRLRIDAVDLEQWVQGARVTPRPAQSAPVVPLTPSPSYPASGSVRDRLRRERAS